MHLIEMSEMIGTIEKWLPHDRLRLTKNKEPSISVIQFPPDLMGVTNKYCKNLNYILPTQKWNMLHINLQYHGIIYDHVESNQSTT